MSNTSILLLGATGYIGGSVLSRLLSHPNKDTFKITTLVRSEEKAKMLESFGVKTVIGSYEDTALVERLAEDAHVVFSCADADALDATNALLAGLTNGYTKRGYLPILIHTSGTGLLTYDDSTDGGRNPDKIYYDDDPDDIEKSFPPAALHRSVDLAIVQADKDGYVRAHIILPSAVWGIAKNLLVDAGISGRHSKQIPALIYTALARGQAGMVEKGQAYWPNVNIEEQADLFIVLYDAIVNNPDKVGHGRDGFYFGENGEHRWYDVSKAIGQALVKRDISKTDELTTYTHEELVQFFGSHAKDVSDAFGKNSRGRGRHSRSLGWQPKLTTQDMMASIEAEVDAIVKQNDIV